MQKKIYCVNYSKYLFDHNIASVFDSSVFYESSLHQLARANVDDIYAILHHCAFGCDYEKELTILSKVRDHSLHLPIIVNSESFILDLSRRVLRMGLSDYIAVTEEQKYFVSKITLFQKSLC